VLCCHFYHIVAPDARSRQDGNGRAAAATGRLLRYPGAMPLRHFSPELFRFLRQLERHNDRDWFARNRERYEADVRGPMLRFISDAAAPLARVSTAINADPRPTGGSMFRIWRDTRFSKNKTPFKTHAAAQFRHRAGRDAHAPCFYLHLEPGNVFFAAGIWHPDADALKAIRRGILENGNLWKKITRARAFRSACYWDGDSAKRTPLGIDPAHPLIEDLLRKDFTVVADASEREAVRGDFLDRFVRFCRAVSGLNAFLARSLGLDW
jgi:uncharacterized protein (TIGR02453 family)